jgi:L-fuculose-phosphate aldolase
VRTTLPTREAWLRAELAAAGAALERGGLVRGREGNLSGRLDARRILITPRGARKGRLAPGDMLLLELDAPLPADASSEARMHVEAYHRLPSATALVHAHPPAVLELTVRRQEAPLADPFRLTEAAAVLGCVALVPAQAPGGEALAAACAEALASAPVAVMLGHGALAVGDSPLEALERLELLELLARLELAEHGRTSALR